MLRPLAVAVLIAAALAAAGCGSDASSSGSTATATVPADRLGAAMTVCDTSFHFSTERDEVGYLQASGLTCAEAKQVAQDYLTPKRMDGWKCNRWLQDDHRYKNDESVSCSSRTTDASVGFTVRWL